MIYNHKEEQDTHHIYRAIIKIIETTIPYANGNENSTWHSVKYNVPLFDYDYDIEIHLRGMYSDGIHQLQTVTFQSQCQQVGYSQLGHCELKEHHFTKSQWSDLAERYDKLRRYGSSLIRDYHWVSIASENILMEKIK